MAVRIGSARIDERGRASGGKAGDQTGREVSTQNWYKHSKGWVVLRATDSEKGQKIAQAMRAACKLNRCRMPIHQAIISFAICRGCLVAIRASVFALAVRLCRVEGS